MLGVVWRLKIQKQLGKQAPTGTNEKFVDQQGYGWIASEDQDLMPLKMDTDNVNFFFKP